MNRGQRGGTATTRAGIRGLVTLYRRSVSRSLAMANRRLVTRRMRKSSTKEVTSTSPRISKLHMANEHINEGLPGALEKTMRKTWAPWRPTTPLIPWRSSLGCPPQLTRDIWATRAKAVVDWRRATPCNPWGNIMPWDNDSLNKRFPSMDHGVHASGAVQEQESDPKSFFLQA